MKFLLGALVLIAALGARGGPASVGRLERARVYGREYIRISDWARGSDFGWRWLRRDDLLLTNRAHRILFTVDSRRAELDGVSVSLSLPIARKDGICYISPLDLETVLHPVLYPARSQIERPIKVICLDPGHGGKDPGNLEGRNQEKKFTMLLAEEIRQLLVQTNLKVFMTRTSDRFVELPARSDAANRSRADLFVSLHFNSAETPSVRGVEVYCMTPAGASSTNARGEGAQAGNFTGNRHNDRNMLLAYLLQRSLVQTLPVEDRGVHRARFEVLRDVDMPAVLIEGGFMSHRVEGKKISDPGYRRQMARAIVDGILAYKQFIEG